MRWRWPSPSEPRSPSLAGDRARGGAGRWTRRRGPDPGRHRRPAARRLRDRAAQDARQDGHLRRRPRTWARRSSTRSSSPPRSWRGASRPPPPGPVDSGSTRSGAASSGGSPRRGVGRGRRCGPSRRSGSGPFPGRRRAPRLCPDDRADHPGRGQRRGSGRCGLVRRPAPGCRRPDPVRDGLRIVDPAERPVDLAEVEPARSIARRFVASAMSVGALSPEAHQAVTIGMQRAGGAANTGEGGEDPAWYRPVPGASAVTPGSSRSRRPASGSPPSTSPGPTSSRSRSPRARSRAKAASSRRRRPPPRSRPSPGTARPRAHQPAPAPRHLLDRGPRPAHRRPPGDQPGGQDRGEARRRARRRDDRRRRGQGGRRLRPPLRPRGRDRGEPAELDQARRRTLGARSRRSPPDPPAQWPARPDGPADGRRPADRSRPADRGAPRRRGIRVRHGRPGGARLRHGPPVPSRHLPDRHRHPAPRAPGEVHRHARAGRAVRPRGRRGPARGARVGRCSERRRGGRRVGALPDRVPRPVADRSAAGHRRRSLACRRRPGERIPPGHGCPWSGSRHRPPSMPCWPPPARRPRPTPPTGRIAGERRA